MCDQFREFDRTSPVKVFICWVFLFHQRHGILKRKMISLHWVYSVVVINLVPFCSCKTFNSEDLWDFYWRFSEEWSWIDDIYYINMPYWLFSVIFTAPWAGHRQPFSWTDCRLQFRYKWKLQELQGYWCYRCSYDLLSWFGYKASSGWRVLME